jgi:hypothetical protein
MSETKPFEVGDKVMIINGGYNQQFFESVVTKKLANGNVRVEGSQFQYRPSGIGAGSNYHVKIAHLTPELVARAELITLRRDAGWEANRTERRIGKITDANLLRRFLAVCAKIKEAANEG